MLSCLLLRTTCRARRRRSTFDETGETEERVRAGASAGGDESRLEDDGEVRGGHEVVLTAAGEDGEEVEEVEEEVAGGGREEGDELAVGGDGGFDRLRAFCEGREVSTREAGREAEREKLNDERRTAVKSR